MLFSTLITQFSIRHVEHKRTKEKERIKCLKHETFDCRKTAAVERSTDQWGSFATQGCIDESPLPFRKRAETIGVIEAELKLAGRDNGGSLMQLSAFVHVRYRSIVCCTVRAHHAR